MAMLHRDGTDRLAGRPSQGKGLWEGSASPSFRESGPEEDKGQVDSRLALERIRATK